MRTDSMKRRTLFAMLFLLLNRHRIRRLWLCGNQTVRTRRRKKRKTEPLPDLLPSQLARETIPDWSFPPHLQALEAACLRLLTDPTYNRLVVEMPVRHGKSWYCSWMLPAAYLLTYPNRRVILTSYEKDFASEWSVLIQSTIRDHGEETTGVRLGDVQRQERFTLDGFRGGLRTASPGSGIAGKGADLIICDDLVKDMKQAANPTQRNSLTTWVNSELLARLEPGGKVLAVMSRRHPDDQSGRWLAQNSELPSHQQWHRVTMPAIDEAGNALWPDRYDVARLLDIKHRFEIDGQSYLWECLYQQNPRGDSSLIEWPDWYFDGIEYDELPPGLPTRWRLLSLDPSKGTGSKTGDYSAWCDVTLDRTGKLWVYPHLRHLPTESVEDYSVELLSRGGYDAFVIECNGFQELIADNIIRKCQPKSIHCPLFKRYSTENKEVRIRLRLGPLLEQKRVRVCTRSTSARLAINQLREFPTAAHDDFPDSLTLCWDLIMELAGDSEPETETQTVYVA